MLLCADWLAGGAAAGGARRGWPVARRPCGCAAVWLPRLPGCPAARLCGGAAVRWRGCAVARLCGGAAGRLVRLARLGR
ncbi:hypothetical protein ACWIGW_10270 [Nocardia brasiliensis]